MIPATIMNQSWFCRKNAPKAGSGETQEQEYGGQAQHEEQRRQHHLAPRGGLGLGHLGHGDPAHVGQIGRHDGQHAGAEERQKAGHQSDQHGRHKRGVYDLDSEHPLSHNARWGRRHATIRHNRVDRTPPPV
jgi:hypothetical protein